MQDTCYLVLNVNGVKRFTKKPPALQGDERAVAIEISVADEIFNYTFLKTSLNITEDDVVTPSLEVEMLHCHKKL